MRRGGLGSKVGWRVLGRLPRSGVGIALRVVIRAYADPIVKAYNSHVLNRVVGRVQQNRCRWIRTVRDASQAADPVGRTQTVNTDAYSLRRTRIAVEIEGNVGVGPGIVSRAGNRQPGSQDPEQHYAIHISQVAGILVHDPING